MRLIDALRTFKRRFSRYQPLVTLCVDKTRLLSNLQAFQKFAPKLKIAPVLKSNAYGHGLTTVAKIYDKEDIAFFVVDSPFEADTLRRAGIKSKILVIGYTTAHNIKHNRLRNIAFTITSLAQLKEVSWAVKKPTTLHLKIDTGMHRQGVTLDDVAEALDVIQKNTLLKLEGVCSHLADPITNTKFTQAQIADWNKVVGTVEIVFPSITYKHLSATGGFNFLGEINANVSRVGIGLYGFSQSKGFELLPALEMQTIITSIREIKAGECVGYDCTFIAPKPMTIATLPVGYFEGVDRRLSNKGFVTVRGKVCPIIGRVSMNICSIDISDVPNCKLNDPVVVISKESSDLNSVEQIAKDCGTIPYEILVHLPPHLRRVVV